MTLDLSRDRFDGLGDLARDHGTKPDLQEVVTELAWRSALWQKDAADAAAATATAEVPFHHVEDYTQTAAEAYFTPAAALTADAANNATLRVRKRKADGTDGGVLFEAVTTAGGTGSWTAFKKVPIAKKSGTLASAYLLVDGESLTMEIAKGGTGVVVPAGALHVFYK